MHGNRKKALLAKQAEHIEAGVEDVNAALIDDGYTAEEIAEANEPEEKESAVKAASRIVDTEQKPIGKTEVSATGGTGGDVEIVRNKTNGNEVKLKGDQARKLVQRKPKEFEIIDPKKK